MLVLNVPIFTCAIFVLVTTKNFPEGTLLADLLGRRPFERSLTHDDYQTLAAMTSNFLQVGIIIFDGSGQTFPKYPPFLKYIKKKLLQLFLCSIFAKHSDILRGSSHVYCYLFPCTDRRYAFSA